MPDIALWNKCNNRCIMCTNPVEFSKQNPLKNYDLKTQIKKFELFLKGKNIYKNDDKKNYINITGGEPTIHPDFFKVLLYFKNKSPNTQITLLTNARRFKDKKFTTKFSKIVNNTNFIVAINFSSSSKNIFEKVTGIKNSYNETLSGMKNLFKLFNGRIEFRIVIHKLTLPTLKKTISFLLSKFKNYKNFYIVLIHYEIEGIGEINNKKIELRLKKSSKYINKKLKNVILKQEREIRFYHFPLCILDKDIRKFAWITLSGDERIYTKKCLKCKLKKKCVGLMKRYYEIYGDDEIKWIRE